MSDNVRRIYGFYVSAGGNVRVWACRVERETAKAFVVNRDDLARAVDWSTPIVHKDRRNVRLTLNDLRSAVSEKINAAERSWRKCLDNLQRGTDEVIRQISEAEMRS